MTRSPLFAAAFLASLLAGCAAIPSAGPEETPATAATMGLSGGQTIPVAPDWWTALGDPQLDRIMEDALSGSPTLDAALARMRVAEAGIAEQKAGLLPQIGADASDQYQRLSGKYIIPPPYGGSWEWLGTAQADLDWSLDLAGKQKAMVDQARATAGAVALDAAAARVTLSGAVVESYINLARADAQAKIAREFLASRQSSLKLAETRKRSGLGSDFEIRAAQTLLAEAQQALVRAEGSRALAVHALAALAGRGIDYYPTIGEPALSMGDALPVPETLSADLLGRRADILAARARVEASEAGRDVARAQFYPDINIRAFAGFAALGLDSLLTGSAITTGIGPAIHLPIFQGGRLRAQYTAANGNVDVAIADYNASVAQAVKQAADALSAVETNAGDAGQQRAIVRDMQETLRLDNVRARTGLGSRLDVLAANDRLLTAQLSQANIDADGAIQRVRLLIALGGGFTPISRMPLASAGSVQMQK